MLTSALPAVALPAPAALAFPIDGLVALPRVVAPAASPGGALVAFTVGHPSAAGDRIVTALHLVPATGGAPRRLVSGARGGRPHEDIVAVDDAAIEGGTRAREGHWIAKPKNARVSHDVVFACPVEPLRARPNASAKAL